MGASVSKVGNYYLIDLQYSITRNYPNTRHSLYYEIQKDSYSDLKIDSNEDEFAGMLQVGILNCINEDRTLKKANKDDKRREYVAATCLALIDLLNGR